MTRYDNAAAAEFYADPVNREPAGPAAPARRPTSTLSTHVPIRFSADVIAQVKRLADFDGVTVSTWIRNLVGREIKNRLPAPVTDRSTTAMVTVEGGGVSALTSATHVERFLTTAGAGS